MSSSVSDSPLAQRTGFCCCSSAALPKTALASSPDHGEPIVVLKFGSSVLKDATDVALAVHEIYREILQGHRVVAVVSAVGKTTSILLNDAARLSPEPEPHALSSLLATGERHAASLLCLAMDRAGVPARLMDPIDARLVAHGDPLDADPAEVDVGILRQHLASRKVLVVPGFFGTTRDGGVAIFGRGGSDLTAIFLAWALGAKTCRLLKDVDGVYEQDPSAEPSARKYDNLPWQEAWGLGSKVVQPKAAEFALRYQVPFEVGRPGAASVTRVGSGRARMAQVSPRSAPLRVGLLGLGTVGCGLAQSLLKLPEDFVVVRAAVRDLSKHEGGPVARGLLTTDPREVLLARCDVVVELMGGEQPSLEIMLRALRAGTHVVTANKLVVACHRAKLAKAAASTRARLLFSAAVGGSLPVIHEVRRAAAEGKITSIEGIVNGTTNYVLGEIARGASLEDAVRRAQDKGFAEANPYSDISGLDAAYKIAILAHEAFGICPEPARIHRVGIDSIAEEWVQKAYAAGNEIRLVASCRRTPEGLSLRVAPRLLRPGHPLLGTRAEQNRVLIEMQGAPSRCVDGKGAGRWPTAESVLGDLFELKRVPLQDQARCLDAAAG